MVYIVMGVSGSGKSTVGRLLAQELGLPFHDADEDHPAANLAKMAQGIPLTDEDRRPWLQALAAAVRRWNQGVGGVLACSALKEEYRRILTGDGGEAATFIYLHGAPELIRSRLESRLGHYFPAALLRSQLETVEVPENAVSVDVAAAPQEICRQIVERLRQIPPSPAS